MDTYTNGSSRVQCEYNFTQTILDLWLFLFLLLIPLFLCVLYVAYKQRKKKKSFSHSDIFTFNNIGMETLAILGPVVYVTGSRFGANTAMAGYFFSIGATGQMCFHCLTCVERYLAVVHPVTYLRLKKRGGVRIRNGTIAGTWVLSVGFGILQPVVQNQDHNVGKICSISLVFFIFVVVTFCSVSVLCFLIRPGPGEGGGDVRRIGQSKQRAFFTIMVILGVLLLRFVVAFIEYLIIIFDMLDLYGSCLMAMLSSLLNFPSSLVLPLMFLQKYGKLPKWSIMNCKPQLKCK